MTLAEAVTQQAQAQEEVQMCQDEVRVKKIHLEHAKEMLAQAHDEAQEEVQMCQDEVRVEKIHLEHAKEMLAQAHDDLVAANEELHEAIELSKGV